jgi:hypothetical protein
MDMKRHMLICFFISNLCFGFPLLINLCIHLNSMKFLGVPFGSPSFVFSFLQKASDEDIYHIVPKVRGYPCGLWNPLSKFCPKAILFCIAPPPPPYWSFNTNWPFLLNPHVGFWEVSKLMFFKCLEATLVFEHVIFPISKRGINLIFTKVSTRLYYSSWVPLP